MTYGPDPEHDKHANRKFGALYNGHQQSKCMSRGHYMIPDTRDPETNQALRGAITPGQTMAIMMGFDRFNPQHFADKWYGKNRYLRVPRVAVLSSFIPWFEQWEQCMFQAPIGPIFGSLCPGADNTPHLYNRITQYNVNPAVTTTQPTGKEWDGVIKAARVGSVNINPMQSFHSRFQAAAHEAALILADLEDPIFVNIPYWCPVAMPMRSNNLDQNQYYPTGRPWYEDSVPVYNIVNDGYHWWFPDARDYRTQMDFYYTGVPALSCPDPGFGVSVLHIYVGMFGERSSMMGDNSIFKWESYPAGPPGLLQANNYEGMYLGHPLAGFNGARLDWHDCGYDYGYTGNMSDPYPYYRAKCLQGYNDARQNFYKYRSYTTELYTFPDDVKINWKLDNIAADRLLYTEGRFWSSECDTLCDCGPNACGPDSYAVGGDTGDGGVLSYGQFNFFDVPAAVIQVAMNAYLPAITQRIDAYYASLQPGTEAMFTQMIAEGQLGNYGYKYYGKAPSSLASGQALAAHIIQAFREQERMQANA